MQGDIAQLRAGPEAQLTVVRYSVAIGSVVIGVLLGLWLRPVLDGTVVLLLAVLLSAWFTGLWPALVASVLATFALDYFFMSPFYTVTLELTRLPHLAAFTLLTVLVASASAAQRRAEQSLKRAHDELELRVRERTADITRANQRLATQYSVTRALAESDSLDSVAPALLKIIGNTLRWEWGALWKVDTEAGVLRCESVWHAADVDASAFASIQGTTFVRGAGLPGRVWHTGQPHWIADVTEEPGFVRVASATRAGLHGAIAFPILLNGETIGAVEFLSRTVREPDQVELDTLFALGTQIGQFIERKQADEALRDSKEQWEAVFENNPTMYFMVDSNGIVLSVNPFGADQLGYAIDEMIGESVLKVFLDEDRESVQQNVNHCLARIGHVMSWEVRKVRKDGSVLWVRETAKAMQRTKNDPIVLIACEDMTSRKRAEQELEELAGRLIHAQEQERSRIGRELHDHISQTLGVLTIKMDQLRADGATPPITAAALEKIRQYAAEITGDVHRLSHRLHSSTLDYLGLGPALQKLVTEFSERHGISIDFVHARLPPVLPSEVALCLFRVTEESLTNIAKHSHSRSARVRVDAGEDGVHLTIEDAGDGFDVTGLESRAGLGFVSMRERLRVLRGTVRIDSAPSRGTRIDVWVPATSLLTGAPGEIPQDAAPAAQASRSVGSA